MVDSTVVRIDARRILGWDTFHDVFAQEMGFPGFYGRNMDAWIDCMTSLDKPGDGMTSVHVPKGGVLTVHFDHVDDLANRYPDIYDAIIECSAFVNHRRIETGEGPVLTLSFHKSAPA